MPEDNRGVVVEILAPRLGAEAAETAADVWQRDYSSKPGFGVVKFIQYVAGEHGLPDPARRKLRLALFNRLYETGEGETAETGAQAGIASAEAPRDATDAAALVGARLLAAMVAGLPSRQRVDFFSALRDNARAEDILDRPALKALDDWDGMEDPVLPSSENALRAIVHAAYLAACDAAGPAAADRALGEAVRRVEALPEADRFSPRALL